MEDLGFVFSPEQFDAPGEEFFLDNSLSALNYLSGLHEDYPDGILLLVFARLANINVPSLPLWLYVVVKNSSPVFLDLAPVFRADNLSDIGDEFIQHIQIVDKDIYFLRDNEIYAAEITSQGHFIVRAVRMILNSSDMENIYMLENGHSDVMVCPVELYSLSEQKFIGACWEIYDEQREICFWYPICHDEAGKLAQFEDDLVSYPIELDETVCIDGNAYKLTYNHDNDDVCFQKTDSVQIDGRQIFAASRSKTAETRTALFHSEMTDKPKAKDLSLNSDGNGEQTTVNEATAGQSKCIVFRPRY